MTAPDAKSSGSYLAAGINAISPWGSRNQTPQTHPAPDAGEPQPPELNLTQQSRGADHTVTNRHRLSLKKYPRDCPPLSVLWFHAVDIPKRKALVFANNPSKTDKPPQPKKWNPFSAGDSRALEATFQKICDEAEEAERKKLHGQESSQKEEPRQWQIKERNIRWERSELNGELKAKVPVNEDFLFDVDVEERELAPAYWIGAVYEVRRGTWFFQESTTFLRPCDENLANQLEEGYIKIKPWRFANLERPRSASQPKSRPTSLPPGEDPNKTVKGISRSATVASTSGDSGPESAPESAAPEPKDAPAPPEPPKTHRLFGAHMNSVVTYQDSTTAWLLTDDFLSRMSSTMYQRFAGGGHFAGVKLIRGYVDLKAEKEKEKEKAKKKSPKDEKEASADAKAEPEPEPSAKQESKAGETSSGEQSEVEETPSHAHRRTLERQMSNLMASTDPQDLEKQEEEVRKRAEREIREDYKEQEGEEQGREIEHLLLVTHGIGQRLGMRMESINFVHDVNTLRKTLKSVYAESADLQALNGEVDKLPKNCRVQVLPIVWRHLLDFPKQSLKHNRREFDLGDAHSIEDDEYPSLENITVEGVPAVRNLITDLALDVLLYQSPAYKSHISRIVLQECNRIYKLFKDRNPEFNGKVSLVGHSLGSAIMFDLLCQQREEKARGERHKHHRRSEELKLDFDVEDFYALGSPIGLFQMLSGKTIAARISQSKLHPDTQLSTDDPFLADPSRPSSSKESHFEITTSSPRCQRIFNIFHPTDPISYRLEPLISPAMSALKPQPLPYTKKGIFGAPVAQGLTGIGARVGQSVSGLWTSLSSGIANSLLNRSLGLTAEDASKLGNPIASQSRGPLSANAGNGATVPSTAAAGASQDGNSAAAEAAGISEEKKRKLAQSQQGSATDPTTTPTKVEAGQDGQHPPTLIDSEIETLYSGFAKRRESQRSDADVRDLGEQREWQEIEERSRKLRREEAKVRALNSNGRVDYSIQEGAFDISLLASIASHLSYYADEDVSHFMISQLLARHRILKKSRSAPDFNKQ
ncbi:DDHD domain-containing protein [Lasiodiplodia theobromae]|uniref:DDHD domain-containing protein n=1 Tax=Lasiodiplodia theobromae TaxID=45133 RepID=UPI0015C3C0EA|nr:DDHD domain-containing protein [Lasiodiplodia theobromae]KAF4536275.1 DDHD domain-containing protein [Lasiodiplodia theobromae]